MPTLRNDLVMLEKAINAVQEKARIVHQRVMCESLDGEAKPSLALMELSVRALGQAKDAARFSRHSLNAR